MEYRIERDSMGEVRVPADRYWGAQTQRSHENFPIGVGIETMPAEIIRAFAVLKKAAAIANRELLPERMSAEKCALIGRVCDEILAGELDGHFPLVVWQTGSGTQSNMNVNEVIANRGNELAGKKLLHPNDDVNMSQSSNDTFPTAMHIAACLAVEDRLLPAVSALEQTLLRLEAENADVLKSGRTHLQDATPITFAQEISGWRTSLARDRELLTAALPPLRELALGGTAVGTGLNAPDGFDRAVAAAVADLTGKALCHRAKQVPRAYVEGRAGVRARRGQGARVRHDEARERCALARLGSAHGAGGDHHSSQRARLIHHARQGQPHAVRGGDDGGGAGHGQRRRRRHSGVAGEL